MKLLMFSAYKPFRAVHVQAVQLNTASKNTNYMHCVNSVRWLNLLLVGASKMRLVRLRLYCVQ